MTHLWTTQAGHQDSLIIDIGWLGWGRGVSEVLAMVMMSDPGMIISAVGVGLGLMHLFAN